MQAPASNPRTLRALLLLLLIPAGVAPFVSFINGYSPIFVLRENVYGLRLLAAPFFLGLPIVLWHARRLVASPATRFERKLIYVLVATCVLVNLIFWSLILGTIHID